MSKNVAMFVDVANMYYAARGQDVDVDYVALLKHATKGRDLIRAYAYTGLDPENENQRKFIDFLAKNGYRPVVKDIRKFGDGRMKANLDIELVVDLFRLADRMDIAVIVSGDGDFAPAIRALQDKGVRAEVISFKPNTSSDLIAVADEFTDIMKIASIGRGKGQGEGEAPISTPEMPAKEVTPEFGFREASPSVAAAALAALRGGGAAAPTNGRRSRGTTSRRTTRSRTAAAPEALPAAEQPPGERIAAAEDGGDAETEARRRRRRRGGRGRGRGRRTEGGEPEGAAAVEPSTGGALGEIGWEEFDDLAQIDLGQEDREYGFTEADPETLAELGLSPEELDATPREGGASEEDEPAASARGKASARGARSGRSAATKASGGRAAKGGARKSAARAGASSDEVKAPRRRSTGDRKSAANAESAEGASDGPETGNASSASDEAGVADSQGIWSRFRSGRRPRPGTAG